VTYAIQDDSTKDRGNRLPCSHLAPTRTRKCQDSGRNAAFLSHDASFRPAHVSDKPPAKNSHFWNPSIETLPLCKTRRAGIKRV
jgi:hypothetical protein